MTTDGAQLSLRFLEDHAADAAAVLEAQRPTAAAAYLAGVPARLAGPVIAQMLPGRAARCMAELATTRAAELLGKAPAGAVSAVLRLLPAGQQDAVLTELAPAQRTAIRLMLRYPATTAGAWMDPRAATLAQDDSVASAWERLRGDADDLERWLHIVDRDQRLVGRLRSIRLLRAGPETPIAQLREPVPHTLAASTDLFRAQSHAGWQDGDPLPLLGRNQRYIGVLRPAGLQQGLAADPAGGSPAGLGQALLDLADSYWTGAASALEETLSLVPGREPRRRDH